MKTSFIYALCEPGTRTIRYIGQTNSLKRRVREHLNISIKRKTHLGNWLRSCLPALPGLVILHEVEENESWQEEERRYISCARAIGIDLVNATDGGEGGSGPRSPECRAAISAATKGVPRGPHSPEHCAAISASHMGVPKGPHTPETRAAISAAQKGVPKTTAHCVAMRVPKPPRSPEHCAALSAATRGVPKPRKSDTYDS